MGGAILCIIIQTGGIRQTSVIQALICCFFIIALLLHEYFDFSLIEV